MKKNAEKMLKIEYRDIDDLIPYARNARTHSEEQVLQIAASIKEFGFTNPILVDGDKGIIAGHGRVMAARKAGLKKVPTIEIAHLTETQRKAYILADNKLALNSGWDNQMMVLELVEIKELGGDVSLIGFEAGELEDLLNPQPKKPKDTKIKMDMETANEVPEHICPNCGYVLSE